MEDPLRLRIRQNLTQIDEQIVGACERSGRQVHEVQLVAVTKYATPDLIAKLVQCGVNQLGESRPQRLWDLAPTLQVGVQWHLIGHLQRNKVARTLPLVQLIHSVDSERLLRAIDNQARGLGLVSNCLLEVNISGDATKHGWSPQEMPRAIESASECQAVRIKGLMTLASRQGGIRQATSDFAQLRELRERLRSDCPPNVSLNELSMGMSGDFEVAIEQGATLIRIGSAIFAGAI